MNVDEDIWGDDLLGRKKDADFLIEFLTNRIAERGASGVTRSYVLNIDARWGEGKTFFLSRLAKQVRQEGFLCAYINAWTDDHADDPLIAVISEFDRVLEPLLPATSKLAQAWDVTRRAGLSIAVAAAKYSGRAIIKKALGEGLDEIEEAVSSEIDTVLDRYAEKSLASFRRGRESIENFRRELDTFLADASEGDEFRLPFFVLIDELDRCRPLYAIALLERAKHLFEVNGVVFVIATDSIQLQHTIRAVYGSSFGSERYLLRFFDRSYRFEPPTIKPFLRKLYTNLPLQSAALAAPSKQEGDREGAFDFINRIMQSLRLSLRDIEQCLDILGTIMTVWPHKVPIQLPYLLPLIVSFQQGNNEVFEGLCNKGPYEKFTDLLTTPVRLTFKASDPPRSAPTRESFVRLLSRILEMKSLNLPDALDRLGEGTKGSDRYVRNIFRNEMTMMHNNHHDPKRPPFSVLGQYPEFVRNAGRLTKGAVVPDH